MSEISETLASGGWVVVRQQRKQRGLTFDTELCSRPIGLMAIAKAEKAGEIRISRMRPIPKGVIVEYELARSSSPNSEPEKESK